jgi:hypothetical protein
MRKLGNPQSVSLELPSRAAALAVAKYLAKTIKARVVVRDEEGDDVATVEPKMDS